MDISGRRSKPVAEVMDAGFDYVITLCGHARETCPVFPGDVRVVHFGFEAPPLPARGAADEEEALGHYRRVRDEIKAFAEKLPGILDEAGSKAGVVLDVKL